ncbi:MAG: single-stranded DNA-binding protein [Myxococcales bacterium]|nr:single-stranded DNA-binding protein [Myxococcales bacterium]
MSSVNKVILVGNLGADPEIRYTQGGQAVCNLRIATSENWNDRDGNRQERTEWHSVTVWGKQAEICGQYLAKGRKVYLEGRIQSREYTDREGVNRRAWDVVANNIVFLSGREDGGGGGGGGGGWGGNKNQGSAGGGGGGGWGGGQNQGGGSGQGWGGGQSQSGGSGGWGGGQNSQPPSQGTPQGPGSNDSDGDDPIPF